MDQYLRAIKPLLPKDQQQDILAELSEEIASQMEERQRSLGRTLTDAEQEEILHRFGHPLIVGGRYQPNQGTLSFGRELIGRDLFPFYLGAMKIIAAISVVLHVLVLAVLSYWEPVSVGVWISGFVFHFTIQFVVITGIFIAIQRHLTRYPDKWDAVGNMRRPEAKNPNIAVRFEAIAELVVLGVVLAWIQGVLWPPHVSLGIWELAPIWHNAYWPLVAVTVATMAFDLVTVFRPDNGRYRRLVKIIGSVVWLVTAAYLLSSGTWVVLTHGMPDTVTTRRGVAGVNEYLFRYGLISTLIVMAGATAWEIFKAIRNRR
ncbi:HAAS signaling domain-containing protein [Fimbriimonas ginsengisoli]|uniref:HAAS signaling domain-containing protein n=1 Tax=Fimbriimonas ginsengisoli TaxID=1005039 RepID=UPI001187213D|nr:hypothetical protein [Fimbriimonas ginsengisoli]